MLGGGIELRRGAKLCILYEELLQEYIAHVLPVPSELEALANTLEVANRPIR